MKRDRDLTYYFVKSGNYVLVAPKESMMWDKTYASLNDAVEAVKRRNKTEQGCKGFTEIENGIVANYV